MNRIVGLALSLIVAGCGGDRSSAIPLDSPLRISGDAVGEGAARVHMTSPLGITTGGGTPTMVLESLRRPSEAELRFTPGRTTLEVTRQSFAIFENASIALGDLHLQGGVLPPEGLELRDLTLVLEQRARADVLRARADLLSMEGDVTFALHWNLVLEDGSLYALGPVDVGPFELHAVARRGADERPALEMLLLCPGTCGEVPGVFQLSDAALDVTIPVALEER